MPESRNTSRETILERVGALTSPPIAFEALWTGDSDGWFIFLIAITSDGQEHHLGNLSGGGDLRIFNGQVPLWPEAITASQLGHELAEQYGAEFYFPSPDHPEEDCPSWKNRAQGYPCRRCGIPLLQGTDSPCPWRGVCYYCHLAEEREQREAQWTPAERAGAKCFMCGNPAIAELQGRAACAKCFDKYEIFNCEKCNVEVMRPQQTGDVKWCSGCEAQQVLAGLSETQLKLIREALPKGRFEAMHIVAELLNCSTSEGNSIVRVLMRMEKSGE